MKRRRQSAGQISARVAAHQLRTLTGRAHALLTGRAAAAIQAALTVIGAAGRPVLIPANTCYIVLWAVLRAGARPVLIDCDPMHGNITPDTLTQAGIDQPAAVIPCHLYGIPAPIRDITMWAKARGAFVIEDAALALGGTADDQPAGSWGDLSVFSFGAEKIVNAGLGGAALTDDPAFAAELMRVLNEFPVWTDQLGTLNDQWGELYFALHRFEQSTPGLADVYPHLFALYGETTAARLPSLAARGIAQALDDLPGVLAHRRERAAQYADLFAAGDTIAGVRAHPAGRLALWRFPLRVDAERRESLLHDLWARGVETATVWYPSLQPMVAALCPNQPIQPTPHADQWGAAILNLPLDPSITVDDAARIVRVLQEIGET